MKIHNGQLFWPLTYDKKPIEKPTIKPLYDCLIIGGGMSGILTASQLIKEGLTVALLDQKEVTKGSTSANTGLLQWTNDCMLHELIKKIGIEKAVRFHHLCQHALNDLEQLASTLVEKGDFIRRPSILFASSNKDVKKIEKEAAAMQQHGFKVDFWDEQKISSHFHYKAPAALQTFQDAEINPYKFANELVQQLIAQGLDVFEHTYVTIIEQQEALISVRSMEKHFLAKNIIYTTGYHPTPFSKINGTKINRSYAIVTNPISPSINWLDSALLWETARPYFYMRKTVDNRIIIGGLDESKSKAPKEGEIEKHAKQLLEQLALFYPNESFDVHAMYGAAFGESKDSLPFIGEHPHHPNHYYLLGYGGNGTVYSMLGANILADLIVGRPNVHAELFTLDRKYGIH